MTKSNIDYKQRVVLPVTSWPRIFYTFKSADSYFSVLCLLCVSKEISYN